MWFVAYTYFIICFMLFLRWFLDVFDVFVSVSVLDLRKSMQDATFFLLGAHWKILSGLKFLLNF